MDMLQTLLQIFPKISWCPHLPHCHNQTAQHVKMGKSFERGLITVHFGENMQVSLHPYLRNSDRLTQVSYKRFFSVTRFIIIRWMSSLQAVAF